MRCATRTGYDPSPRMRRTQPWRTSRDSTRTTQDLPRYTRYFFRRFARSSHAISARGFIASFGRIAPPIVGSDDVTGSQVHTGAAQVLPSASVRADPTAVVSLRIQPRLLDLYAQSEPHVALRTGEPQGGRVRIVQQLEQRDGAIGPFNRLNRFSRLQPRIAMK